MIVCGYWRPARMKLLSFENVCRESGDEREFEVDDRCCPS